MSRITQIIVPSRLISSIKPQIDITGSAGFVLELKSQNRSFSFDVDLLKLSTVKTVVPNANQLSEDDRKTIDEAVSWNSVFLATFTGLYRSNIDLLDLLKELNISSYTDANDSDEGSFVEIDIVDNKVVYCMKIDY